MNEIIKNIEAAQLKETVKEYRFSKEQSWRDRVAEQERHLQLESFLTESVLRRLGRYTHQTLRRSK